MFLIWASLSAGAAPLIVTADPVGTYLVRGENPGSGAAYFGSVDVKQTGETYSVVWMIDGVEFGGTGLGAVFFNGDYIIGPANSEDTSLAVSYASGSSFGLA
jgi:hypothetical protein